MHRSARGYAGLAKITIVSISTRYKRQKADCVRFMSRYCSMMTYITYRPTYNKGNPGKTGRFKIHVLYSRRSSRFIFALQHYKYRYRKSEKIFLSVMEKKKRRMGVDTWTFDEGWKSGRKPVKIRRKKRMYIGYTVRQKKRTTFLLCVYLFNRLLDRNWWIFSHTLYI